MSRAARAAGIAALCMLAIAGIAAGVWVLRIPLAHWLLLERIAALGIAPASLRVERVDRHGIAIADVRLGGADAPDLAIAKLDATWSPSTLRERRLDSVRLVGVRLRATQRDAALSFGALDAWIGAGANSNAAPALPADAIELGDARIAISTPNGVAQGTLVGSVTSAAGGVLDGRFTLALGGAGLRAKGTLALSGTAGEPAFEARLEPEAGLPVAGRIEARGHTSREKGKRSFDASVALRNASYTGELVRAAGVNGVVALQGPPLRTPTRQIVSVARIDLGVPLSDGLVEFTVRPGGVLAIERATLHLASGELRAEDVVLDARAKETAVSLRASGVDLTELLAQVDLPGVAASGKLDGAVPVVRKNSALFVEGGELHAREGGGTIQYTPSEKTRALAASRPNDLGLAIDAFSDFHYDALEAKLDGDLQGEMKIGLHVHGVNPGFQDGRPVELNLSLDARVADLVRAGATSYRVPGEIEERLRAFSEGRGK